MAVIATQIVRIVVPQRGPYLFTLGVSAAGVVAAELVAGTGRLAGLSVGAVHPVLDVVVIAILQCAGALLVPAPPERRR